VLQSQILLELGEAPAASVDELAKRLEKLRPSVSRALKLLETDGLVQRDGRRWLLTSKGADEALVNRKELEAVMTTVQQSFRKMMEPATDAIAGLALRPALVKPIEEMAKNLSALAIPARELASVVDEQQQAVNRALAPLFCIQQRNSVTLASLVLGPSHTRLADALRTVNVDIARTIEHTLALSAMQRELGGQLPPFPPLQVHLPEIAAAFDRLTSDLTALPAPKRERLGAFAADLTTVSSATESYAQSLYLHFDRSAARIDGSRVHPGDNDAGRSRLRSLLRSLGSEYVEKYEGMWNALDVRGPDYLRQSATSARELVRTVPLRLVPGADLDDDEINSLIKPRFRRLLGGSKSRADWVWYSAKGAVAFYDQVNAYTHEDRRDEEALRCMYRSMEGVLLLLLIFSTRHK
jgi:predicted transcriptional regulator